MEHKNGIKKNKWWILCPCLFLLLAAAACVPARASGTKTLRVPFVELDGLMEKDSDGSLHGLVIDYLNEIAKYTNWEYEYIETTAEEMLPEFIENKYDLMGGSYYVEPVEEYCEYPDYPMGYSKGVIMARKEDNSIRGTDVQTLNGKTIGVYERAEENVRRLKEFLSMNGVDCTLKYYSYEELTPTGNLYPYLENGEVDLLLGNNTEGNNPFRVVFSYASQPYYIVTQKGNQEVLDELNMALEKIQACNPDFAEEHYNTNFQDFSMVDVHLEQDELDYIRDKKVVTVAVPKDYHPLSCKNTDCIQAGLVSDILEEVSDFTGLQFSCVYVDYYADAERLLKHGEVDMLGFYQGTDLGALNENIVLTAPYANINSIVVRNKKVSFPADNLMGAIIEGRELPSQISVSKLYTYKDAYSAMEAVNHGEVDFVFGLAPYLESVLQSGVYVNVVPVTIANSYSDICFALRQPADLQLLAIMNKSIYNIPMMRRNELLDQNMFSVGTGHLSMLQMIYANPLLFAGILSVVILVLAVAILWVAHIQLKASIVQSNLEKAKAESKAKGEFLSRMSHELRTPMNAVVGLVDLINLEEGVPGNVQKNLSKLRSSAGYLLDLINDILDSSRLDSGMITVVSEPFSLKLMLFKIQDMLEEEARQRNLSYVQNIQITHGMVMGDATRLRQVIVNLLSNAFKFTGKGGNVILEVTETPKEGMVSSYFFSVTDNGVGVAEEDQERIFDTFEQVGTNYAKSQGTGLGLSISRKIVEKMGGELRMTSKLHEGSRFFFTIALPYKEEGEVRIIPEKDLEEGSLEGVRILLVEDNDLNAEIAQELFEMKGAIVTRAENGKIAVDLFTKNVPSTFQAIVMDIQMPEMNGLDATRTIRGLDRRDAKTIPIIATTANAFQEDTDAALEAGMNGFVSKPLDIKRLFSLIYSHLKENGEI